MTPGPIRELREALAASLKPLGIEVYDVLPENVEPPAVAVGLPAIGPSLASTVTTFTIQVILVGERASFADAQLRLDDLEWEVWVALRGVPGIWLTTAEPGPIDVAAQSFPAVTFTLEAPAPC